MNDKKKYRICKVLNNNVVLALNLKNNKELILIGNGIGFGKRTNDIIPMQNDKIKKTFITYDNDLKEEFLQLISVLDEKVIEISEKIIAIAEKKFGKLNSHIHIALTDHIGFAIDRVKMGMEINNPFSDEIKILYPKEYEIGIMGVEMIKERLGVEISDSEIGFIALHIHAAMQNKKAGNMLKNTSIIKELIEIIERELKINIKKNDISYNRLMNHLKFTINRIQENKEIKNPLLDNIKKQFKETFIIARKIGIHIEKSLGTPVCENELGYLTIHIQRLKLNSYNN